MEGIRVKKYFFHISVGLLILVIAGYFIWTKYGTGSKVEPVYVLPFLIALLVASFVFLVLWIRENTSTRVFAYGSNTVVMVVALIAVLFIINYISDRHNYRKDFTSNRRFSLSDQTEKIMKGLEQNITILGFYQDGDTNSRESFKDLVEEYIQLSSRINYKLIDPIKNPNKAMEYGIKQLNTVIVEVSPQKREKLTGKLSEQALTNAIMKLARKGTNKVVYFLKGHKELDINQDLSKVRDAMEKETYEVRELLLFKDLTIPQDCSILVIAGPLTMPEKKELEVIDTYLRGGGKLMVMVDPMKTGLEDFLGNWGVIVENDLILDFVGPQLVGTDPSMPLSADYPDHEITKDMKGMITIYPVARSVSPVSTPKESDITTTTIIQSLPQSWSYRGKIDFGKEMSPDQTRDKEGPVSMGVAVTMPLEKKEPEEPFKPTEEKKGKEIRLVVVGNSSFIDNKYLAFQGNSDMFLNIMNWLSQEEDLISIRPKDPEMHSLDLKPQQSLMIALFALIVFPLLLKITGISVWLHRR